MSTLNPRTDSIRRMAALAGLALVISGAGPLHAQADRLAIRSISDIRPMDAEADTEKNALEKGRYAILIDLDENRLYFKQGETTLWSAPVGTGTGMRVITEEDDWEFSTPTGRFQVQYKERDPVWIAPDWFFVENNRPVPPKDHPSRYMPGSLGVAAVYISPHLAIHGTDKPELIGQRVSHGCIRLENRYALRLYNNVQVGTEVIIVGGDEVLESRRVVDLRKGYDPSLASQGRKTPPPVDRIYEGWKKAGTEELLEVLDEQLAEGARESRWDEVAILLVDRAVEGDDEALQGVFTRSGDLPSARIEREWSTLLAETYRRAPVRTLEALADLGLRQRRQAADLIVSAMVTLYYGDLDSPSTPWPTTRLPRSAVSRQGQRGWDAIVTAEQEHRGRILVSAVTN